ncbi:MAG: response regulator [bacterium]|nr:response regulator [bacterium]
MIKVLLVDDEQFIRSGMRQLINWNQYGYEIAAEAENGTEALRLLEANSDLELVFADIRMPEMTGIELIEQARKKITRQVHFVILTGYADFDYVREALRLQVADYLLKPIGKEDLLRVLADVSREYSKEARSEREKYEFHISRVLTGKFSKENLMQVQKFLEEGATWKYVSFEFDETQNGFGQLPREERMEQQKQLAQYMYRLLESNPFHVLSLDLSGEDIFGVGILLTEAIYETMHMDENEYLDHLLERVTRHFHYAVQVYSGQTCGSLKQLSESFYSIRVARCLHGLTGANGQVTHYEEMGHRKAVFAISESEIDQLLDAVEQNQREEIERCSGLIFDRLRGSDINMEMVNANIYHILFRLMKMAEQFDDETNQQEIVEYIGKESFNKLVFSGNSEEITNFFEDYAGYLAQVRNKESKKILDRVDEYVQNHYTEKISLKSLGEMFYINSVYLGQIYKKKYGIVFREYLNNLRMKKAEDLLVNTDMRIYAIAEAVGFGKAEYFINKFVQTYQMTPNQYRIYHSQKDKN